MPTPKRPARAKTPKRVKSTEHDAKRANNPSAERQRGDAGELVDRVTYARRNKPEDAPEMYRTQRTIVPPQLVWNEKYEQDQRILRVPAPPCYTQEVIHAKQLVEDLRRPKAPAAGEPAAPSFFAQRAREHAKGAEVGFYQHPVPWENRLILGDSLQVMASLVKKDGLRGKVQCIYMDPPYGIDFKSNFQPSTRGQGTKGDITRDPEMVQAFRDTWKDDEHSYLTYLRDRLQVAHDLLAETGSLFFQISDINLHLCRCLLDEVFDKENYVTTINFKKTSSLGGGFLDNPYDYILWYAKDKEALKEDALEEGEVSTERRRKDLYEPKGDDSDERSAYKYRRGPAGHFMRSKDCAPTYGPLAGFGDMTAQSGGESTIFPFEHEGHQIPEPKRGGGWKTNREGMERLKRAGRVHVIGSTPRYVRHYDDFPVQAMTNLWSDTTTAGFAAHKVYVVQTLPKVIERCILLSTKPGDLVLDPTCGSGTTAYVAEQWGRRWITIDTSKVAVTLTRERLMGARFPYYLLADSEEGAAKETKEGGRPIPGDRKCDVSKGFVYQRVPRITLRQIARNEQIDLIWEKHQKVLEPLLATLNRLLGEKWEEWEVPPEAEEGWNDGQKSAHAEWCAARARMQEEMDKTIASRATTEMLYDKPFEGKNTVRVSGPFTVESLSPRRFLSPSHKTALASKPDKEEAEERERFVAAVRETLAHSGIALSYTGKEIHFDSLQEQTGRYLHLVGSYRENGDKKRAAVFVGPLYGTVHAGDMEEAAKEAEAQKGSPVDTLFILGFAFEAHAAGEGEKRKSGLRVLRVNMNQDLQMGDLLDASEGKNLFVVVGAPDIEVRPVKDDMLEVEISGINLFLPEEGGVVHRAADHIACWFIDTDYDGETFFVRHAYFPGDRTGKDDPFKRLKTALKAEVDERAWASLNCTVSRPFKRPEGGLIAVKAINDYGDEVLQVCEVPPRGASGG